MPSNIVMSEDAVYRKEREELSPEREADIELHREIGKQPGPSVIAFELMVQFIERCIEDHKDATPFRDAAIMIATGCRGARV